MILQSDIEKIAAATDLVALVSQYLSRPLRKSGVNYIGHCPFHNEKTPSFVVSPKKQLWDCKGGCGGGNAFNFIQLIERVSFPESVKILAARAGVELSDPSGQLKNSYADMIAAESAWWYRKVLRAYREREMLRWQFANQVYAPAALNTNLSEDLRFEFISHVVRCRRSGRRWQRIIARFENLPAEIVVKKYYSFRQKHPEVVRFYRQEQEFSAACENVEQQAAAMVADLWPESFEELLDVIGDRLTSSVTKHTI